MGKAISQYEERKDPLRFKSLVKQGVSSLLQALLMRTPLTLLQQNRIRSEGSKTSFVIRTEGEGEMHDTDDIASEAGSSAKRANTLTTEGCSDDDPIPLNSPTIMDSVPTDHLKDAPNIHGPEESIATQPPLSALDATAAPSELSATEDQNNLERSDASAVRSEESPRFMDAKVTVRQEGVTFIIGENATVHFDYGARINQTNVKHVVDIIIQELTRSHHAEYDMTADTTRGPCTPGTRVVVLQKLVDWCNSTGTPLYWLSGMAGTGKTTITYSLCCLLRDANLLGASFFCSRSIPDCRNIILILSTIAYQLARKYPPYAEALTKVLSDDGDILRRGIEIQLQKLVIEPWTSRKDELPSHVIVVIDALDECDDQHAKFLQVLFEHITMLPFKILVASRPEPSIRHTILSQGAENLTMFILHDVEESLVKADIMQYLRLELSKFMLPELCSPAHIQRLADQCGKYFIYAVTLCRFIGHDDGDPLLRLESLIELSPSEEREMAMEPINSLYRQILQRILSKTKSQKEVSGIKLVLDTIVCAQEPLTRSAIVGLLQMRAPELEARLRFLRSFIFVPEEQDRPLAVFHASLPDFMLDPSRSGEYCCVPQISHLGLSTRCLVVMSKELQQNICNVPGRPQNSSISPEMIRCHISPSLRYAVMYWIDHLRQVADWSNQDVMETVRTFLKTKVLNWIECLSFLGRLAACVQGLGIVHDALAQKPGDRNLVYDLIRFIQHVYDVVEDSAMEIYVSALIWVPHHSPLRDHYATQFKSVLKPVYGLNAQWMGPERVITTCGDGRPRALAISHDGHRIVSGCGDNTVRLWDMRNQIEECVLEGHTIWVNSVALFKDGNRVVSGSEDGTIRVWNTVTLQAIIVLRTSSSVHGVAISPDEEKIASGHEDGFVHIWDTNDGSFLRSLQGHSGWVRTITFVPNTNLLVSGSTDNTARIWNSQTGVTVHVLNGHTDDICCVASSSDGTKIITGSWDKNACVWDASGTALQILRGHSNWVQCAAFLTNGKRAVTGSDDGTLRIWDVNTGNTLHAFTGAGYVGSLSIFPDGERIASCSGHEISIWRLSSVEVIDGAERAGSDGLVSEVTAEFMAFASNGNKVLMLPSLRILDTMTLKETTTLHSAGVDYHRGALSASASKVAAATWDPEISLWELASDGIVEAHRTLQGHTAVINSVLFSHNERQLVSASTDSTARVWDVATGTQLHILAHPDYTANAYYASFSHSNIYIVSSSYRTVRTWDIRSGQELHSFGLNTHYVTFTPDDRHIIARYDRTTVILNDVEQQHEHQHEGYSYWITLGDGTSYALKADGWVCRFTRFDDSPDKLLWIPPPYRQFSTFNGPLFTSSPRGIQLCLPRKDNLAILLIPHDYASARSVAPS